MPSLLTSVVFSGSVLVGSFLYDLYLQRKDSQKMLELEQEDKKNTSLIYERREGTANNERLIQMIYHLRTQVHQNTCELISVELFRKRVNIFMWATTFYIIVGHLMGGLCRIEK